MPKFATIEFDGHCLDIDKSAIPEVGDYVFINGHVVVVMSRNFHYGKAGELYMVSVTAKKT